MDGAAAALQVGEPTAGPTNTGAAAGAPVVVSVAVVPSCGRVDARVGGAAPRRTVAVAVAVVRGISANGCPLTARADT